MKTLMILGALEEFVPLVRLAKENHIRTVVVDGNAGAPAKQIADAAYDENIRDTSACAAIAEKEHVDAITTAYSDLLLECMVKIADKAGLPCHLQPEQLPYYRDKDVINRTCEKLGIPTPGSVLLHEGFSDKELYGLQFPMVLKPLDMYGSRGLVIVHNIEEIRKEFAYSCSTSKRKEVLAEEYDPDYEFNIQCWVHQRKVHVLGLADREKTFFDVASIPLSTRNIYPSRLIGHVFDEAKEILTSYIRFTGQTEGPLSMQFFWGPKRGLMVGEIAARFLGYEHELIRYADDLGIEDLLLAAAVFPDRVDELLSGCNPFGSRAAAVLYLHARDGILFDEEKVLAASKRSDVKYSQLFYQKGDRIGNPENQPYFARFDLVADTRAEIDERTRDILSELSATDENGQELLLKGEIPSYRGLTDTV